MNILVLTYALDGLLMIAIPVGLAIFVTSRWKLAGRIWWIGALTFILSQVGHLPFNALVAPVFNQFGFIALHPNVQLVIRGVFIGLSAGIFEEGARYLILFLHAKDRTLFRNPRNHESGIKIEKFALSWRTGFLFGAGHGGAEAIILGALVIYGYIQLLILRTATADQLGQLVGQTNVELAQTQLTAAWTAPWYETLLPAFERLAALIIQISMAVLVMQTFLRKQWFWVLLAVLYHALIDFFTVPAAAGYINIYASEAIVGGFAILSLVIIFLLRQSEPDEALDPVPVPVQVPAVKPVEETDENLDSTRYQ